MARLAPFLFGSFLIAAFFGLTQTEVGLDVTFTSGWTNSRPAEIYFWLATALLLLPGASAIGWALRGPLTKVALAARERLWALERQEKLAGLLGVFSFGLVAATLLNQLVFLGQPFTDDESGIRYGGRLFASGRVTEPAPDFLALIPTRFLYLRDGLITSFDWLGGQLAWAVAELTATENAIFAVFAAAALTALVALVSVRLGVVWGAVAGIFFVVSPMAVFLSGTSHAHVISRGLLALSLLAWVWATEKGKSGHWFLAGLLAAGAWITRPPEITALWLPFGVLMVWEALKGVDGARRNLAFFLLGAVFPLAAFLAHSVAVTGTILPARFAPNEIPQSAVLKDHIKAPFAFLESPGLLWTRFGANVSYNAFMLAIAALGPVGLILVAAGASVDRFTKLLSAGLVLALTIALLHDNYGLHLVGPIHYSESVVPLLILAVYGLRRIYMGLLPLGEWRTQALVAGSFGLVIALSISNVWYLSALHRQAKIHDTIYGLFDDPTYANSIVLGPSYASVWGEIPEFRETGGFVFAWRRMHPDGAERVTFGHYIPSEGAALRALQERYPEREIFLLGVAPTPPYVDVRPLKDVPATTRRE